MNPKYARRIGRGSCFKDGANAGRTHCWPGGGGILSVATLPRAIRELVPLIAVTVVLASIAFVLATRQASANTEWTYDARIDIATLPASHGPAPEAVDWDEDGDTDLVVGLAATSQYGGIALFLRGQDGTLPAEPVSVWAGGSAPASGMLSGYYRPVVADWNGDGKKDLLYGQQSSNFRAVVACLNRGTDAAPVFQAASCSLLKAGGHFVGPRHRQHRERRRVVVRVPEPRAG